MKIVMNNPKNDLELKKQANLYFHRICLSKFKQAINKFME